MSEPTAPSVPESAPPEVKDFFDCRGNTLAWQPGEVTWLGLPVTPTVTFGAGATPGSVSINVSLAGGLVSFTLPASVNAAGELVVDTSSVPDLSDWGLGGRADIDAAIKRINDWFKHNGKKLKPARLVGDTVTLEKMAIGAVPAQTVPVVPQPPVTPPPTKPKPAPTPPPAGAPSGGGCSMLFVLMLLLLVGVISVGGYVGFVYFGGPGVAVAPTASPTTTVSPAPTPRPTTSALATLTAQPSVTPQPTVTAQPTTTATPTVTDLIAALCARVVHRQFGDFLSYIEWLMYWDGFDVDHFVVTVNGANNGSPVNLVFQPDGNFWGARLGLFQPGTKRIVSLSAVLDDGSVIDITDEAVEILGESMRVRYPQEDAFGNCEVFATSAL